VPRHNKLKSPGPHLFHREDTRARRRHHRRSLIGGDRHERKPNHDAEGNARFHVPCPFYASNAVYGDLTCNDSLPQLSTATPNAFCNVKPTRDTGLLSAAM
jgi:hypothetical protein